MKPRVYLDHNATSPLRPEARDAMIGALDCVGNPSSIHSEGRAARKIVEDARDKIAGVFEVKPSNVIFTSGGTEAANWLLQPRGDGKLLMLSTEHACVMQGHRYRPEQVSVIPVSGQGIADLTAVHEALQPGSVIAVQAANNETGVIQPLGGIADAAKTGGAAVVCDAVQATGRIPVRDLLDADVLFLSAHKFGGPKGAGAVIFRDSGLAPEAFVKGGGQERRRRSGTENVAGIAGMAAAFEAAIATQAFFAERTASIKEKIEKGLRSVAPEAMIFGEDVRRLPNTTCFAIPGKSAATLLMALDMEGVAVSSGSACSSGKVESSHVLAAMGVSADLSGGAIRVSSGWNTTEADAERLLAALEKICGAGEARQAA